MQVNVRNRVYVIEGRVEDFFSVEDDSLLHCLRVSRMWAIQTALFMRDYFTGEVAESDLFDELARCYTESGSYSPETQELYFGEGDGLLLDLFRRINGFFTEWIGGVESQLPPDTFYRTTFIPQESLTDALMINLAIED